MPLLRRKKNDDIFKTSGPITQASQATEATKIVVSGMELPTRALLSVINVSSLSDEMCSRASFPSATEWQSKLDVAVPGKAPEKALERAVPLVPSRRRGEMRQRSAPMSDALRKNYLERKRAAPERSIMVHRAMMELDKEINSIVSMLEAYAHTTDVEELYILRELYYALENWLSHAPSPVLKADTGVATVDMIRKYRKPVVQELFIHVASRLFVVTGAQNGLEMLAELDKAFARGMQQHGKKVDVYCRSRDIVDYLTPAQRDKFRLRFEDGLAYQLPWWLEYEPQDAPRGIGVQSKTLFLAESEKFPGIDGKNPNAKMFMDGYCGCVMSIQRDFYCAQHRGSSAGTGFRNFFHSSYMSGESIAFAGSILIDDGVVKGLCNDSGHYQPPPEHLFFALEGLKYHGVDLSLIEVFGFVKCRKKVKGIIVNKEYTVRAEIGTGDEVYAARGDISKLNVKLSDDLILSVQPHASANG